MSFRPLQPPIITQQSEWLNRLRKPPTKIPISESETLSTTDIPKEIDSCNIGNNNKLHFTFNNIPNETSTLILLDLFEKNNIYATFFVDSINAQSPNTVKLLKLIQSKGHIIGSYMYEHVNTFTQSNTEIISSLDNIDNIIYKAIGKRPYLIRTPYEIVDIHKLLQQRQYLHVTWDIESKDLLLKKSKQNIITNAGIVKWTSQIQPELILKLLKGSDKIVPINDFLTVSQKKWLCEKYECQKEMNNVNSMFLKMCTYNLQCEYNDEETESDLIAFRRRSAPLFYGDVNADFKRDLDLSETVSKSTETVFIFAIFGVLCLLLLAYKIQKRPKENKVGNYARWHV